MGEWSSQSLDFGGLKSGEPRSTQRTRRLLKSFLGDLSGLGGSNYLSDIYLRKPYIWELEDGMCREINEPVLLATPAKHKGRNGAAIRYNRGKDLFPWNIAENDASQGME